MAAPGPRRRDLGGRSAAATRTQAALSSLETLAVINVLPTETTELPTHLLPAVGALERADVPWLLDSYQLAVATQFTPALVAPVAERWPVWRMFAELGERLGLDVLGGGLTASSATDEALLRPLAERSRGGADAVFAARHGTVDSGAIFGWPQHILPEGRWRLALPQLISQLAEARASELGTPEAVELQLIAHPHGWSAPNVSELTSAESDIDRLTGMVWQSAIPVEVRAVKGP